MGNDLVGDGVCDMRSPHLCAATLFKVKTSYTECKLTVIATKKGCCMLVRST